MLPSIVVIAMVEAAAPTVMLDIGSDAPCGLAQQLPAALAQQQVAVGSLGARLMIRINQEAVEIALISVDSVMLGQRTVRPSAEECPVLPQAIAALVRAWLQESIAPPTPPPAPPLVPVYEPMPMPELLDVTEAQVQPETAPLTTTPPVTADDVELSPPPALAEKRDVPQVDDRDVDEEIVRANDESAAVEHRPLLDNLFRRSFTIEVSGGPATGPDDLGVWNLALAGDVSFSEPWGIVIDGGLETSRANAFVMGSISTNLSWFGVYGRYALYFAGASGLHLSIGLRIERIDATLFEALGPDHRDVFTGAAVTALEWRQVIDRGFFLGARVYAQVRPRAEVFSVPSESSILTVPPFGFGVSLAVGWTFF